ncbi:MAG: membrane protein insertase YidC, partial [Treponema sp.]|nr:membrane protein insertase YidC [Treponema sp.]
MEKNTLLAIVLSVVVLGGFYVVQGIFFPPAPPRSVPVAEIQQPSPVGQIMPADPPPPTAGADIIADILGIAPEEPALPDGAIAGAGPMEEQRIQIRTDFLTVELSNAGGTIVSYRLNRHYERRRGPDRELIREPVNMIFSADTGEHAFTLAFGPPNTQPVATYFNVNQAAGVNPSGRPWQGVIFYQYFSLGDARNTRFRLEREYRFYDGEYMFELIVRARLPDGQAVHSINFDGYTLSFGPQIGPPFERIDRRQDYRQFFVFDGRRRSTIRPRDINNPITTGPRWAAIGGQYFALIAIPNLRDGFTLRFTETQTSSVPSTISRLHITRPPMALTTSWTTDYFLFYLGPRRIETLRTYDRGDNAFAHLGMQHFELTEMAGARGFLAPLQRVLMWFLELFYGIIPNYGVAIILLTLLVRIVFFPLSKKGSEATLRMQEFAPKIKELQEKYKDNRQKLNAEMAELYKKGGYNPLKGCLPMLLQLPIFFAMFNLFRTHFELRGATFIPGWIPDLSVPEYIWLFPDEVRLPLLGWDAIRLLPFLYAGSQLLYGRVTQTPDQKGNP